MADNDMNRGTAGVVLPNEVSDEIWSDVQEQSAVMRFAQRINLPGAGQEIQIITGDPTADWVAETVEATASQSTLDSKVMVGYKLTVIEAFSNEFRRDLPGLYEELARRLPGVLAAKYDATVFHGTAPGSNFDVLSGATAVDLLTASAYADLVAIDGAISTAGGFNSGFVLAPKARGVLLGAVDASDRPLLINDIQRQGAISSLLGVDTFFTKAVYKPDEASDDGEVIGFAGDWSDARYGVVEDISVSVSDQATITQGATTLNLWARDMFALKATVHLGFGVRDVNKFVKITSGVNTIP